jgi:transcriptional regulator with XRE-family HTH domain
MHVGYHVLAWRRHQRLTQADLAERSGLTRPYLSRLEKGLVDPALSVLRRLAVAFQIGVGRLIETLPPERVLDRAQMDRLARGALRPGTQEARLLPETRILAAMIRERRKALGFHVAKRRASRHHVGRAPAIHASRWLRASLGEKQWSALLRRIDKLASIPPKER